MIERLSEKLVYQNRFLRVYGDHVRFSDGREDEHVRLVPAEAGRGVVLIAEHRGRVAVVRTYRYAIGREQRGLPRGFAHGTDELATVRAELYEETGSVPATSTLLGVVTPDAGLQSQEVAIYHVVVTEAPGEPADPAEVLGVEWLLPGELSGLISIGAIEDGFTAAAWCLYLLKIRPGQHPT